MDKGATVVYNNNTVEESTQFPGGKMNAQQGGWRSNDNAININGTCDATNITIDLTKSTQVTGLVFSKLKPVKIMKSLDFDHGNKALEDQNATFTNDFNGKGCEHDADNSDCSPALNFDYSYPDRILFSFWLREL